MENHAKSRSRTAIRPMRLRRRLVLAVALGMLLAPAGVVDAGVTPGLDCSHPLCPLNNPYVGTAANTCYTRGSCLASSALEFRGPGRFQRDLGNLHLKDVAPAHWATFAYQVSSPDTAGPGFDQSPNDCGPRTDSASSGLHFLYEVEPWGKDGWNADRANGYTRIDICESTQTDEGGFRYVFWKIQDRVTAEGGYYLEPSDPAEEWKAVAKDATSVQDHEPFDATYVDCGSSFRFALDFGVATLEYSPRSCDYSTENRWSGSMVEWWSDVPWERKSKTFVYGLVTRIPAGSASVLDVTEVARVLHWTSWSWSTYVGEYSVAAFTTSPDEPPGGQNLNAFVAHGARPALHALVHTDLSSAFTLRDG